MGGGKEGSSRWPVAHKKLPRVPGATDCGFAGRARGAGSPSTAWCKQAVRAGEKRKKGNRRRSATGWGKKKTDGRGSQREGRRNHKGTILRESRVRVDQAKRELPFGAAMRLGCGERAVSRRVGTGDRGAPRELKQKFLFAARALSSAAAGS